MKKIISVILLAALSAVLLTSCSGKGSGKGIVYPLAESPATLDPQYATGKSAETIIYNVFEGLVRLNDEGEIEPGLAESWSTDDGLTYTFNLRESEWFCLSAVTKEFGQDFFNRFKEEKVTAEDFVFACRRTVDPEMNSPLASRMFGIENAAEIFSGKADLDTLGVKAVDSLTLEIKLKEPDPEFLMRLTESEFMPCNEDFFNAMNGRYGLSQRYLLCNGPFYLLNWDPETSATVKRNDCYVKLKDVLPSSVKFTFENNTETILKKLSTGDFSAALLPPGIQIPEGLKEIKSVENTVYGFAFNCKDDLIKNLDIRLALCRSIDRSLFVKDDAGNTFGFIPGCCYAGRTQYSHAVDLTGPEIKNNEKSALTAWKAGLKELNIEVASLTVLCTEKCENNVKEQIQIWERLFGMNFGVTVKALPESELVKAVESGNYQAAFTSVYSDTSDALAYLRSFDDGGVFRFDTDYYNKILDRLSVSDDSGDIVVGCYTAEKYLLENAVFYPLFPDSAHYVASKDIDGINITESDNIISFIKARRFD